MNDDRLFDHQERRYYHEIETRDKLAARHQLSLGLLLVLGGMMSFMVQHLRSSSFSVGLVVFWILMALCLLFGVGAAWYFKKSWFGHEYLLLNTPSDTEAYRDTLRKTYEGFEDQGALVERYFRKYIYDTYVVCASHNIRVNDLRSHYLDRSNRFIIFSFLFAFIALAPFFLGGVNRDSDTQIIRLERGTNRVELIITHAEKE